MACASPLPLYGGSTYETFCLEDSCYLTPGKRTGPLVTVRHAESARASNCTGDRYCTPTVGGERFVRVEEACLASSKGRAAAAVGSMMLFTYATCAVFRIPHPWHHLIPLTC